MQTIINRLDRIEAVEGEKPVVTILLDLSTNYSASEIDDIINRRCEELGVSRKDSDIYSVITWRPAQP